MLLIAGVICRHANTYQAATLLFHAGLEGLKTQTTPRTYVFWPG